MKVHMRKSMRVTASKSSPAKLQESPPTSIASGSSGPTSPLAEGAARKPLRVFRSSSKSGQRRKQPNAPHPSRSSTFSEIGGVIKSKLSSIRQPSDFDLSMSMHSRPGLAPGAASKASVSQHPGKARADSRRGALSAAGQPISTDRGPDLSLAVGDTVQRTKPSAGERGAGDRSTPPSNLSSSPLSVTVCTGQANHTPPGSMSSAPVSDTSCIEQANRMCPSDSNCAPVSNSSCAEQPTSVPASDASSTGTVQVSGMGTPAVHDNGDQSSAKKEVRSDVKLAGVDSTVSLQAPSIQHQATKEVTGVPVKQARPRVGTVGLSVRASAQHIKPFKASKLPQTTATRVPRKNGSTPDLTLPQPCLKSSSDTRLSVTPPLNPSGKKHSIGSFPVAAVKARAVSRPVATPPKEEGRLDAKMKTPSKDPRLATSSAKRATPPAASSTRTTTSRAPQSTRTATGQTGPHSTPSKAPVPRLPEAKSRTAVVTPPTTSTPARVTGTRDTSAGTPQASKTSSKLSQPTATKSQSSTQASKRSTTSLQAAIPSTSESRRNSAKSLNHVVVESPAKQSSNKANAKLSHGTAKDKGAESDAVKLVAAYGELDVLRRKVAELTEELSKTTAKWTEQCAAVDSERLASVQLVQEKQQEVDSVYGAMSDLRKAKDDISALRVSAQEAISSEMAMRELSFEHRIAEINKKWGTEFEFLIQDHHLEIADLQQTHSEELAVQKKVATSLAARVQHLEAEHKAMAVELARLNVETRDQSMQTETVNDPAKEMLAEVQSLEVVLQMKSAEMKDLRRHNMDLQLKVDQMDQCKRQAAAATAKNEELKAQLESVRALQRTAEANAESLRERGTDLDRSHQQLVRENEELHWRLKTPQKAADPRLTGDNRVARFTALDSPPLPTCHSTPGLASSLQS